LGPISIQKTGEKKIFSPKIPGGEKKENNLEGKPEKNKPKKVIKRGRNARGGGTKRPSKAQKKGQNPIFNRETKR